MVLGLLLRRSMHGYRMRRILCSDRETVLRALCVREGTLYPLLRRLERRGWIQSVWDGENGKRRRREYRITERGRQEYRRLRKSWIELTRAVERLCSGAWHAPETTNGGVDDENEA